MNPTELKTHLQDKMRNGLAEHLATEHQITDVPRTRQAQAKLHAAQDHGQPAQDAASSRDASVLAGVTRKPDEKPAANQPKPKPAARKPVKDVPLPADSKPAQASKPAARKPAAKPAQPATTVVFYLTQEFQVHKPGCRQIAADKRRKVMQYAPVPLTLTSQEDIIRELWSDQIAEQYDGQGEPTNAWLHEHGYDNIEFHGCTDGILKPFTAEANGASPRQHNQELARMLVDTVAKEFGNLPVADQQKMVNWLHALPTGGAGWERYWPEGLVRPNSAGWRKPE